MANNQLEWQSSTENKKLLSGKKKKKNTIGVSKTINLLNSVSESSVPKGWAEPRKTVYQCQKEIIWRDVGNIVTIYDSAIFLYKVFQ